MDEALYDDDFFSFTLYSRATFQRHIPWRSFDVYYWAKDMTRRTLILNDSNGVIGLSQV
jgi:hypothetical protein